jgi:peptidoglycan/LPS O-acetylase OafA/YrhL
MATLTTLALFFITLLLAHTHFKTLWSPVVADYFTAVSFAVFLYALLHDRAPSRQGSYARVASVFADCSYTLYVVHIPLLVFLRALLISNKPWNADPFHLGVAGIISVIAFGYTFLLSRLTEARTDSIRRRVMNALGLART